MIPEAPGGTLGCDPGQALRRDLGDALRQELADVTAQDEKARLAARARRFRRLGVPLYAGGARPRG